MSDFLRGPRRAFSPSHKNRPWVLPADWPDARRDGIRRGPGAPRRAPRVFGRGCPPVCGLRNARGGLPV